MEALVVTASAFLPNGTNRFSLPQHSANKKPLRTPVRSPTLCSSRKNADADEVFKSSSQLGDDVPDNAEVSQDMFQSSSFEADMRKSDIWKLFKEARQNILYLNNKRLLVAEELSKVRRENQLLLDRIEKLEAEHQAIEEPYNQLMFSELLLRIDSMVLTGVINMAEASDLRKVVMGSKFRIGEAFFEIMEKSDVELLAELRLISDESRKNTFHVVHICSEMTPLVSVGSLASYVMGLSKALQRRGHFIEVILPKYAILDLTEVQRLREVEAESYSYFNGQLHGNRIWTGVVHGIAVTFIQPLYYSSFFNRERVYGYSDDFERFTYFSRASLDYIAKSGKQPDVLHIHNWETAIVGPLFWDIFVKQALGATRILLTCHQLDSQCLTQPDKLALCGLDPARLHRPDRLQDDIQTHLVNVLKGGIVYSNKVTVSAIISKAKIIQSLSHGLESTLTIHKDKLLVAPYGIDNSIWDPSKDKLIPKNYSPDDMKGKAVCRVALQQRLALSPNSSSVLVGCIFSESTDFDMENLKAIVQNAVKSSSQFIFMGSKSKNRLMEYLQKEIKDEAVRFINEDDEALSHLIFAGADIILCQSFNDPMHHVAVKALKYGATPVAMTTNMNKFRHWAGQDQEESEFLQFINSIFGHMSLSEALDEIRNNPSKWEQKTKAAMSRDFSWDAECCDIHVAAYTAIKNL